MNRLALAAALALLAARPAEAAEPCDVHGYLAETVPADGVAVRRAPDGASPVIATLPAKDPNDPDQGFAPSLTVTAIENGFAEVRDVVVGAYFLEEVEDVFVGPGWVPVSAIATGFSADPQLRAEPSADAPVVLTMQGEDWGADSVAIAAIRACRGAWIEVDVATPDGRRAHGWGTAVCGNQATTCN